MILRSINNDFESYQQLITFYQQNKDLSFADIDIELSTFFAANMSASLGAVLDQFAGSFNDIHFKISPQIERILQKNDFLTFYGRSKLIDNHHTTIRFQKLKPTDGKYFKSYVTEELINRNEMPSMSLQLKEKMAEAIYEIFINAQIHSETQYIYTCGQAFPKKSTIAFSIVDTGIGFKERINRRFGTNMSASKAIEWAVKDTHTSKTEVSGGIGLALLREFVTKNKGCMQIVSNDGFYQFDSRKETLNQFSGTFPGTIVNLQFNTNDASSYKLKSEIDINEIF